MNKALCIIVSSLLLGGCQSVDKNLSFVHISFPRNAIERHYFISDVRDNLNILEDTTKDARNHADKMKVNQAWGDNYVQTMDIIREMYPSSETSPENKKITTAIMLVDMYHMWLNDYHDWAEVNGKAPFLNNSRIPEKYNTEGIGKLAHDLSDMLYDAAIKTTNKSQKYYYLLMSKHYLPSRPGIDKQISASRSAITWHYIIHRGKSYDYRGTNVQDVLPDIFWQEQHKTDPEDDLVKEAGASWWDPENDRLFDGSDEQIYTSVSDTPEPGTKSVDITLDILRIRQGGSSSSDTTYRTVSSTQHRCEKVITRPSHSHHRQQNHIRYDCHDEPVERPVVTDTVETRRSIAVQYKYSARSNSQHFAVNKQDTYQLAETSSVNFDGATGEKQSETGTHLLEDSPVIFAFMHIVNDIYASVEKKMK